jgi:hypothetical protein
MKEFPNFYENIKEARLRLRNTTVVYDGDPYSVLAIAEHTDGIFRVYMIPLAAYASYEARFGLSTPPNIDHPNYYATPAALGEYIDTWMKANPKTPIIRKMMNSPKFNKFRPFPLGMCNHGNGAVFIARQPQRKTEQGLVRSMMSETPVGLSFSPDFGGVDMYGAGFIACIKGEHPSPQECLKNLLDPDILNNAVAFDRNFALVRGPIDMIFLAYKTDIVGLLPHNDLRAVRLGRDFAHTAEVIADLKVFATIQK